MTEDRLEALLMLSAHRQNPSVEEVVNTFAASRTRGDDLACANVIVTKRKYPIGLTTTETQNISPAANITLL